MSEAAPYEFMFKSDGTAKIPELLEFQRAVRGMPEYKDMFRPTAYLERGTALHFRWEPKLLYFAGSWEVPGWFPSGGAQNSHFVNPNARDRKRYTISGIRCACGNVITDIGTNTPHEETHDEGCTVEDRKAVVREIKDIRLQRVVTGAHLNQSWSDIAPSLGMIPRNIGDVCEEYGIDWTLLRDVGRHRMAATIDILRDQGYTYAEIGEAFGSSEDHIYDYSTRKVFNRRSESVA